MSTIRRTATLAGVALLTSLLIAPDPADARRRARRPAPPPASADALPFDPGDELVVRMKRGAGFWAKRRVDAASVEHQGELVEESPGYRLRRLRVPRHRRAALMRRLARDPDVERVEPNQLVAPSFVPNDPEYEDQWHLPLMGAEAAWEHSRGKGITIAILDSGVDVDHPDLVGRLKSGFNFWEMNTDTDDVFGHGTAVAGAAAATANNGSHVAGVGNRSKILPVRVTGTDGWASIYALGQGIAYAVDQGARVVNMSFQGLASFPTLEAAAAEAAEQGVVVIAAAGNCGCTETFGDAPHLISVGATTRYDEIASFSSQGVFVDIAAPGKQIRTTTMGGGAKNKSGTSYAAPVAAGLAAMMLSANPSLEPEMVASILKATAVDLGEPGWDPAYGHGRINAEMAVAAAAVGSVPACSDGFDNDGDGFVDHPEDPDCEAGHDWYEGAAACGLGFEAVLFLAPWAAIRARRRSPHRA